MARAVAAANEQSILRARARGEVSAEQGFEKLYALHAPLVLAWLRLRVPRADAEDLQQDVWMVLYDRWKRWEFRPEMESPEARPVLSFLFRTCHFVLRGYARRAAVRAEQPLDDDAGEARAPDAGHSALELGRCLDLARRICPLEEQEVLAAKLSGVPARDIARTLTLTEAAVDHRFRSAIARLRRRLRPSKAAPRRRVHA
jgi:RNA polymerase sigma factor (sigma-70 family)